MPDKLTPDPANPPPISSPSLPLYSQTSAFFQRVPQKSRGWPKNGAQISVLKMVYFAKHQRYQCNKKSETGKAAKECDHPRADNLGFKKHKV